MKTQQQILVTGILLMGFMFLINFNARSQKASKQKGTITTKGYWIHDKVKEIPGLKTGPFVRLDDGSILTIEKNMSCISKDEGKTWKSTPYLLIQAGLRFVLTCAFPNQQWNNHFGFANDKERANWDWNKEIADSPGATIPTYAIRSLDGGKTWQDLQKLHEEWTGANRDIIETKEGNIIFTSMMMRHNPGHHTVVTYTSKTNGFNWIRSNVIDLGGVGHHSGVTEATIEQLTTDEYGC